MARVGERPDHPAKFIVDLCYKRAATRIGRDLFQAHPHLRFRRFVAKLAHQLGKRCRIVYLSNADR